MRLKITLNYRTLIKGPSLKASLFTLFMFCNYYVFSQTTHNITNPSQLTAAFSATLAPGDTVILADGTYTANVTMRFNAVGTAANPITLKAATPGGVKFTTGTQTLKIGGEYCIIDGFYWNGGFGASNFIEFRDGTDLGNNSTLQNCVIDGLQVSGGTPTYNATTGKYTSVKHNWIVMYGTYNTVINCSIMNKTSSGNMILVELLYNTSRCDEVGHKIINNYFYNYAKINSDWTNAGDSEAIRIGVSNLQSINSNAIVQNNYFVQCDGENEIITNKSKGNSYINNTFRRSRGSLVLRHGSNTTVNGNYFLGENVEGTGGIRIVDSNQSISNNYIQDCVTTTDNAIWNNGITFLGGNDSSAVPCTSTTDGTSGYQKVQNIDVSNNTIVNTNAPLFFNINTGTTKSLGTVSNNLIYFASSNSNITPVITGNTTSPIAMGTSLTYSGNEYSGTTLGETTYTGFSENTGITANYNAVDGIFTFTGATGKGADMSGYSPANDGMVGYGIGACFVNNIGGSITNGNCNVLIPESLIVSSLSTLTYVAASYDVTVTANVSWTAVSNDAWITTINPNSGSGDATVSVTVTENTGTESRTGSVTFTQVGGDGDGNTKTLSISQDAPPPPDPRDGLNLINVTSSDAAVAYVSYEEVNGTTKFNYAINSLDKDFGTNWAGDRSQDTSGRSIIVYDLKGAFDLQLVDIATSNGKTYNLQIWVSSTGTADEDFTNPFPAGDMLSNSDDSFKAFVLPTSAIGTKYVKIIGNGQPSGSNFTSIHEIEFYGDASTLSVANKDVNQIKIYPNPVKDIVTLKNIKNNISLVQVFTIDGRKVMEKAVKSSEQEILLDMTSFENGAYILNIFNGSETKQAKMIMVSH